MTSPTTAMPLLEANDVNPERARAILAEALSGAAFGIGAGVYGMWFDYGYIVPGTGDGQHRIGLSIRPGRMNAAGAMSHEAEPKREFKHRASGSGGTDDRDSEASQESGTSAALRLPCSWPFRLRR